MRECAPVKKMIFSVSPLLSSAFIALIFSPACVYFLAASCQLPWRLATFAIRCSTWSTSRHGGPLSWSGP